MTQFQAMVTYRAFPPRKKNDPPLPAPMRVVIEGDNVQVVLEDLWRRFNHAQPGKTGDLAEQFGVRSMCVGDEVSLQADGSAVRRFVCAGVGWKEIGVDEDAETNPLVRMHRGEDV